MFLATYLVDNNVKKKFRRVNVSCEIILLTLRRTCKVVIICLRYFDYVFNLAISAFGAIPVCSSSFFDTASKMPVSSRGHTPGSSLNPL